ncbi:MULTISPECIES: phosphoribosylanthranilate isomerase [Prosthecochloris]|uniref:N-(5'-phosphoribosyl)anthranilate isomerase n=1 Tax=Prosthecochloris vibrioformis TaxID=1098 RepID=A0A5C4RXJ4_PROVB|nr:MULTISPECIES: phosphoribosylanthranilate isomerase [Prosthecochloris]ANT65236.1 N-(5'-phosphoribosyl)anthranilate isomerase [Prosthecochloris sp. CIB 2401]TNJ36016.1 phosphoribosylanthranilate isomerase [Prosthecochloris vibrioformis]
MTRIKICGITTLRDALVCIEAGVHALGFNFSSESPRAVSPDKAHEIIRKLPPFVTAIGVFVEQSPDEVCQISQHTGLHAAQLHSERYGATETLAVITQIPVIKVFRTGPDFSVTEVLEYKRQTGVHHFLFDAYRPGQAGGTGERIKIETAKAIFSSTSATGPSILAGGLKPDNIEEAIRTLRPYAVDTASGVELAPGQKDPARIQAFTAAVRRADTMA